MNVFILDTDILSLLQEGDPIVSSRVLAQPSGAIAVTIISVEEQLAGWYTRVRRARGHTDTARAYDDLARSVEALGRLPILRYSLSAIARFEQLRAARLNIGAMDLRIAAIVLENNATLVTRNTRDFQRVPNLTLEDWSQ